MLSWSFAFLLGVVLSTTWPSLLPLRLMLLCVALVLVMGGLCAAHYRDFYQVLLAFFLGIAWCSYRIDKLQLNLPHHLFNKPIVVSGSVVSFPEYQADYTRFNYCIEKINGKPCKRTKIVLTDYHYHVPPIVAIKCGERWQLPIRLKKPRGFWNPGSFDYQAFLLQHGIIATGTVIRSAKYKNTPQCLPQHKMQLFIYALTNQMQVVRKKLSENIQKSIGFHESLGLLQALVIGIRHKISAEQWAVMRATGTNHLFAISGLHVGFIGGILYKLVCFLWSRSSRLCLWRPAQQAATLSAWLGALCYSAISGFALPIQRTMMMFTLLIASSLRGRVTSLWQGWHTTLIVMLLLNPLVVLSESFWLSFGAVAVIFYGLGGRLKLPLQVSRLRRLWEVWGKTQCIVSIGLTPITTWFFQQLSLLGVLANLVAIPCVGFIILPTSLLAVLCYPMWPQGAGVLLRVTAGILDYLWQFLSYIATVPLSHCFFTIPNRWILISTQLSALLFIAPRGFPSRYYLGVISLLPFLLWKAPVPQTNEFWLTLLDVGQGLAAVVRTHKHVLVYDTGPRLGSSLDAGNAVVVPYLRTLGVRSIDRLIVSHGDNDHSGGVNSLLKAIPVKSVLSSQTERLKINIACYCQQGQQWEWDGVRFAILHPDESHALKSNDASCVLHVSNSSKQLLLPGDIHYAGEKVLLKNNANLKEVTLLVAPHHGSKTSSSTDFVRRTSPQYVLFPIGYQNRFKFPHPLVVDRYRQHGSKLYSTAEEGMITVKFHEKDHAVEIERFYEQKKRFWHAPLAKGL